MKRIELEIPDWALEGPIFLSRGMELVAYKWPGEPWKVKTGRCKQCGNCCWIGRPKRRCEHLKDMPPLRVCDLGSDRPWSCSIHSPVKRVGCEDCSEKFE